jgi:hypothetical protein
MPVAGATTGGRKGDATVACVGGRRNGGRSRGRPLEGMPMPVAGATTGGRRHDRRQPTCAGGLSRRRSKAGATTGPGGRRGGGRSLEGRRLGRRG